MAVSPFATGDDLTGHTSAGFARAERQAREQETTAAHPYDAQPCPSEGDPSLTCLVLGAASSVTQRIGRDGQWQKRLGAGECRNAPTLYRRARQLSAPDHVLLRGLYFVASRGGRLDQPNLNRRRSLLGARIAVEVSGGSAHVYPGAATEGFEHAAPGQRLNVDFSPAAYLAQTAGAAETRYTVLLNARSRTAVKNQPRSVISVRGE